MSHQYFRTSDNTLIFQYTAHLLREKDGRIQPADIDLIISVQETQMDHQQCFKASYINSNLIKSEPFSKLWLEDLKSLHYGQPVTEYLGGPLVYYFDQEQLLEAVIQSFTNDKMLNSQISPPTTDLRPLTSDIRPPTSDLKTFRPLTSDHHSL